MGSLLSSRTFSLVSLASIVAAVQFSCSSNDSSDPPGQSLGGQPGTGGTSGAGNGTGGTDQAACPEKPAANLLSEAALDLSATPLSAFIVVDQFGYRTGSEKIAVIRSPEVGFDADQSFTPGSNYELINAETGETAVSGAPAQWNGGAVHDQSGDVAWHFDFSSVSESGLYYVRDTDNNVRSDVFQINDAVYRDVLAQAVRTFFYQRAGYEKKAEFAGESWADGASHIGPGQDKNARLYSAPDDATLERDLSGGWYDAGDMNKYTAWTADYIVEMARAYHERPEVFWDDYNLPDSGNCIPDLVDEMRFGLEHLLRLQEDDGSVLSIVDEEGASPPSSATAPSQYGPASTNSTIRSAAAYAWGARVLATFDAEFANVLTQAAQDAWTWALANPDIEFFNNDGTNSLGAGQQQPGGDSAWMVDAYFLPAALALYQATGDASYKTYFEAHFSQPEYALFKYTWLSGYNLDLTETYLEYIKLPDAKSELVTQFLTPYLQATGSAENLGMLADNADPYLARASDVGWGSNAHKSRIGLLMYSYVTYDLDATKTSDAERAAERFIHAIHGVNPLGLVYLSNMGQFGAASSVTQFYHSWFTDGSDWDEVGVSKYGPAPGFLVGGPNASYNWDAQCPGHASCPAAAPSPPFGQPDLKSYAQFNDNWPLNSWEVTENSNGYQLSYIRLLSKFVN